MSDDDLSSIIPSSLAHDPDVYQAIKDLTLDAIAEARERMRDASPAIQLQLIRAVLPAAARALAAKTSDDGYDELKAQVGEMYEGMRKQMGITDDDT